MTTHTPGPWTVRERSDDYTDGYFIEAVDRDVCTVAVAGHTDKAQFANARLIAAAPDLLELVQYVDYAVGESMWKFDSDDDVMPVHMTIKALRDVRALLARIRGEG